jgi:hypothetical protein
MSLINFVKSKAIRLYYGELPEVPFDNGYPWLGFMFQELMKDALCARKPMYTWGVIQGAALAKILHFTEISVLEFGVAGGAGLVSLEHISEIIQSRLGLGIDVYGFDTGIGHPKPRDYRDQPNMWFEGQLPMKQNVLEQALSHTSLILGLIKDTLPMFLSQSPAPVAFISFDFDLYSSTRDALQLFNAPCERLLPRIISYFDDINGHTYSDFTGERLAISEFNCSNERRKLSPIYNLKFFVPRSYLNGYWWDSYFYAHIFEHPLYNMPDSINKGVYTDVEGGGIRAPIDSDWRSRI